MKKDLLSILVVVTLTTVAFTTYASTLENALLWYDFDGSSCTNRGTAVYNLVYESTRVAGPSGAKTAIRNIQADPSNYSLSKGEGDWACALSVRSEQSDRNVVLVQLGNRNTKGRLDVALCSAIGDGFELHLISTNTTLAKLSLPVEKPTKLFHSVILNYSAAKTNITCTVDGYPVEGELSLAVEGAKMGDAFQLFYRVDGLPVTYRAAEYAVLDDVRVYNRLLTEEEIAEYTRSFPPAGPTDENPVIRGWKGGEKGEWNDPENWTGAAITPGVDAVYFAYPRAIELTGSANLNTVGFGVASSTIVTTKLNVEGDNLVKDGGGTLIFGRADKSKPYLNILEGALVATNPFSRDYAFNSDNAEIAGSLNIAGGKQTFIAKGDSSSLLKSGATLIEGEYTLNTAKGGGYNQVGLLTLGTNANLTVTGSKVGYVGTNQVASIVALKGSAFNHEEAELRIGKNANLNFKEANFAAMKVSLGDGTASSKPQLKFVDTTLNLGSMYAYGAVAPSKNVSVTFNGSTILPLASTSLLKDNGVSEAIFHIGEKGLTIDNSEPAQKISLDALLDGSGKLTIKGAKVAKELTINRNISCLGGIEIANVADTIITNKLTLSSLTVRTGNVLLSQNNQLTVNGNVDFSGAMVSPVDFDPSKSEVELMTVNGTFKANRTPDSRGCRCYVKRGKVYYGRKTNGIITIIK